jgi:hypothetical protein
MNLSTVGAAAGRLQHLEPIGKPLLALDELYLLGCDGHCVQRLSRLSRLGKAPHRLGQVTRLQCGQRAARSSTSLICDLGPQLAHAPGETDLLLDNQCND